MEVRASVALRRRSSGVTATARAGRFCVIPHQFSSTCTGVQISSEPLPTPQKRTKSSGLMKLPFALLGFLALGCGHPATAQECEEIADRVTRLELQSSPLGRDPDTAKEQLERTRSWVKESQLKSCVGRRITDAAMQCVRAAKKSTEITDRCFR